MVDVSHVVQAMNGMREAFTRMEGALNRVCEQLAESMPKPHPVWEKVEPFSHTCLLYTSPSPRDGLLSRMPSSA